MGTYKSTTRKELSHLWGAHVFRYTCVEGHMNVCVSYMHMTHTHVHRIEIYR
jgi:hypothetical protein